MVSLLTFEDMSITGEGGFGGVVRREERKCIREVSKGEDVVAPLKPDDRRRSSMTPPSALSRTTCSGRGEARSEMASGRL